jgi:transposase-like protein
VKQTYPRKTKLKAIGLVRKGYSYAAAGKEIGGASRDTVKRWCDEAGVRSGAADARTDFRMPKSIEGMTFPDALAEIRAREPAAVEDTPDDSLESVLRGMQKQLRWTTEQAEAAAADGNPAAASKLNRDEASLANTIARIKADLVSKSGEGGLVFSAEKLKATKAQLIEMVNRLAASPEGSLGVCPRCGADIRMARASAPDADKEA